MCHLKSLLTLSYATLHKEARIGFYKDKSNHIIALLKTFYSFLLFQGSCWGFLIWSKCCSKSSLQPYFWNPLFSTLSFFFSSKRVMLFWVFTNAIPSACNTLLFWTKDSESGQGKWAEEKQRSRLTLNSSPLWAFLPARKLSCDSTGCLVETFCRSSRLVKRVQTLFAWPSHSGGLDIVLQVFLETYAPPQGLLCQL